MDIFQTENVFFDSVITFYYSMEKLTYFEYNIIKYFSKRNIQSNIERHYQSRSGYDESYF